ncbi:reverse transcriptase [Elysia marginata]|uniref:Reverse transcriptase n=1 Tax=Elysia marginata TaxID=1093978 RepID=A0AAV4FCT6_9GAST|nr:reverse transcriptase [Elysia marginata]
MLGKPLERRTSLECTDWSVFVNSTQDMSELADTVCCYINFCIETAIPTKTIKVFSNNKPWVTKDIKQILNRKKIAFQNKRDNDIKSIHKEVRATIRQGKESYRRKIEKYFKNNDMRKVWQGMNLMVGCKGNNSVEGEEGYANDLNKFYARFDCHDFVQEREECKSALLESLIRDRERIVIDESEVRKAMLSLKPNKAPGPDGVKPSVLKKCAEQLSGIMCEIFNMSLKECKGPKAWKTSCIVPFPKKQTVKCMNDLRPIALTSCVMTVFERCVMLHLQPLVSEFLDPLQFAYRAKRSVDDAILLLLIYILIWNNLVRLLD